MTVMGGPGKRTEERAWMEGEGPGACYAGAEEHSSIALGEQRPWRSHW